MLNAISKVNKMLDRCLIAGEKRHCSYLFRIKQLRYLVFFKKTYILETEYNKDPNQWLTCYWLTSTVSFPVFLILEDLQKTTWKLQRGTGAKGTVKQAKPEDDYPGISKEQVEASSEPPTFSNGWRMGDVTEWNKFTIPSVFWQSLEVIRLTA